MVSVVVVVVVVEVAFVVVEVARTTVAAEVVGSERKSVRIVIQMIDQIEMLFVVGLEVLAEMVALSFGLWSMFVRRSKPVDWQ